MSHATSPPSWPLRLAGWASTIGALAILASLRLHPVRGAALMGLLVILGLMLIAGTQPQRWWAWGYLLLTTAAAILLAACIALAEWHPLSLLPVGYWLATAALLLAARPCPGGKR